jgi:hypothetical protein
MTRLPTRNALLVIGVWEASNLLAILIRVLLIPLSNRLIFTGNAGNVAMWLWEGFPDALVAAVASIVIGVGGGNEEAVSLGRRSCRAIFIRRRS